MMRPARAMIALSMSLLVPTLIQAGDLVMGGQQGTDDPPHPTQGANTEEDWNPIVTCVVPSGGTIDDLLDCLLDRIATPPPPCPILTTPPGSGGSGHEKLQKTIAPP